MDWNMNLADWKKAHSPFPPVTRGQDADVRRKTAEAYPAAVSEMHQIQSAFENQPVDSNGLTNARSLMKQMGELQKFVNYVTPDTKDHPKSEFYDPNHDPKYMHVNPLSEKSYRKASKGKKK